MFIFLFKNLDVFDISRWNVDAAVSCSAKDLSAASEFVEICP